MQLFPLYANLKNKHVVVIGGGDVAERKVQLMLQAGALIHVVALSFNETLEQLAHHQRIALVRQPFEPSLLDDAWFVIAATNQKSVNAQVAHEAGFRKLFVNVVDDPALSSVQVPAIINRSPLMVAVSSTGAAPMLARHVREQIETIVDDAMGRLALLAQTYRQQIRQRYPCISSRRHFYEWLIQGEVLQLLRNGHDTMATQCLENALQQPDGELPPGYTFQISIPDDDPGNVTLRTLRALNQADTVFHDDRIDSKVLDLARRDAHRCSYAPSHQTTGTNVPDSILQQLAHLAQHGNINVLLTRPDTPSVAASQNCISEPPCDSRTRVPART